MQGQTDSEPDWSQGWTQQGTRQLRGSVLVPTMGPSSLSEAESGCEPEETMSAFLHSQLLTPDPTLTP